MHVFFSMNAQAVIRDLSQSQATAVCFVRLGTEHVPLFKKEVLADES